MGINCTDFEDVSPSAVFTLCKQLEASEGALQGELIVVQKELNVVFILWAGALVFSMHMGFAMLSVGSVRTKNAKNILMMILLDACMCAIAWWLLGYGFAYGTNNKENNGFGFVGVGNFVGMGIGTDDVSYEFWFFQYCFAATAATIVSGAVAERATFEAYLSYSFYLSIWVYPVVAHWVWGGGFLTAGPTSIGGVGAIDFAGCGPVHMVGGVAGAIGSKLIGPRVGRFNGDGSVNDIPGHNTPLMFLGTFILWIGWLGFNPGSALVIYGNSILASRAAVNTILSSATGALSALFVKAYVKKQREWDIGAGCNGCLAGLVAITSACSVVEMWAALIIGLIAGPLYVFMSGVTVNVLRIDDPLDATPVHLFCGFLGLVVTGFFAKTEYVQEFSGALREEGDPKNYSGIFYGGNGHLLGANILEAFMVLVWVGAFITPYFFFLRFMSWFRVSREVEELGLDHSSHGGHAYPEDGSASRAADQASEKQPEKDTSVTQI